MIQKILPGDTVIKYKNLQVFLKYPGKLKKVFFR